MNAPRDIQEQVPSPTQDGEVSFERDPTPTPHAVFIESDDNSPPRTEPFGTRAGGVETQSVESGSPTVRRPALPAAWLAVLMLSMIYFIQSGVDNATSSAMFSKMRSDFDASNFQMATTQRMSEAAKIVGSSVLGHFGVHTRSLWVCVFCIVFSMGCVIVGVSPVLWLAGIGYFGIGLGYATTIVLTPPIMDEVSKDKPRVSFYLGIIMAVAALGVVSYFVLAAIPGSVHKWRMHYLVTAAACFLPFSLLSWTQRKFCSWSALPAILCTRAHRPPFLATILRIVHSRQMILLIVAQTFVSFYTTALALFIPQFVQEEFAVDEEKAATVMAIAFPGSLLGIFFGGYLVKWRQMDRTKQSLLILVASVFPIPILATVWYVKSLTLFTALLILAMLGGFIPLSPFFSLLALLVSNPDDVPYANSLSQFASRLFGGITGPIVLGLMLDNQGKFLQQRDAFTFLGLVGGVGMACCMTIFYILERQRNEKMAEASDRRQASPAPQQPPSGEQQQQRTTEPF